MLLDDSLGSLDGIEVGFTEVTELCIYYGILLGTTLGKYDGTDLGLSYWSSDVTVDYRFGWLVDVL